MEKLAINNNEYKLERFPLIQGSQLRAWNSADEYLLNTFFEFDNSENKNVLLVNDQFGALTIPLINYKPGVLSDSFMSKISIEQNLIENELSIEDWKFYNSAIEPDNFPTAFFDFVLIKIPKSISYLKYQLNQIKKSIHKDTVIIASGMTKHLSPNTHSILEECLGETKVDRTFKKSVLFRIQPQKINTIDESILNYTELQTDINNLMLATYPNVFSQEKVDNGTRLLLSNLPDFNDEEKIVDLGCGSGIIGLKIFINNSNTKITCIDESYLAVKSAEKSFELNNAKAEFLVTDGLNNIELNNLDYVISNPPFHNQTTLDNAEAERHFKPIKEALKNGGRFIIVCNRSLNYEPYLKKYFSAVKRIESNNKYFIIECIK
ncbi:MAG: methyltransferase [Melioribacteraceae bacterium]|nr:methyltransferase [Melioribacteraceae bacterium]